MDGTDAGAGWTGGGQGEVGSVPDGTGVGLGVNGVYETGGVSAGQTEAVGCGGGAGQFDIGSAAGNGIDGGSGSGLEAGSLNGCAGGTGGKTEAGFAGSKGGGGIGEGGGGLLVVFGLFELSI